MCFNKLQKLDTPQVAAHKVFGIDSEGRLVSPFTAKRKHGQFYPPNQRIPVDEGETFFAFQDLSSCLSAIVFRRSYWRLSSATLLVLPVTLHGTIHAARYDFPNEDIQCCDPSYPAYCATEIEVHDSPEARRTFYHEVVKHDLRGKLRIMDRNLATAYRTVLPELCVA